MYLGTRKLILALQPESSSAASVHLGPEVRQLITALGCARQRRGCRAGRHDQLRRLLKPKPLADVNNAGNILIISSRRLVDLQQRNNGNHGNWQTLSAAMTSHGF